MKFSLLSLLMFILILLQPLMAYNGGYSPGYEPYRKDDCVKPFPLIAFTRQPGEHKEYDIFRSSENFEIKLDRSCTPPSLKILRREMEVTSLNLPEEIYFPYLNEAYRGDLNGDGVSDYICVFGGTGCGLAGEYCHVIFLFSWAGKYTVQTLYTMGFGPEDVVDWYGNGKCTVIHTWFIHGDAGKDGTEHNYWVYNFLDVAAGGLILSERLPWKWIMYTHKPNHMDTVQLTDKQKIHCWLRDTANLFIQ